MYLAFWHFSKTLVLLCSDFSMFSRNNVYIVWTLGRFKKHFFFSNNCESVLKSWPGGPIAPKKNFGAIVGHLILTHRHALFCDILIQAKFLKIDCWPWCFNFINLESGQSNINRKKAFCLFLVPKLWRTFTYWNRWIIYNHCLSISW